MILIVCSTQAVTGAPLAEEGSGGEGRSNEKLREKDGQREGGGGRPPGERGWLLTQEAQGLLSAWKQEGPPPSQEENPDP